MMVLAGINVGSPIKQGEEARAWGSYQKKQADADAAAEVSAARVHAEKIRRMARAQAGEANAALAASGVSVGEGTALRINEEIYRNAEEDAVMTIFGGADSARRMQAQGKADKLRGKQAETAGWISAAQSVMSAYGSYGRSTGWRTSASANGTNSPAGGR